MCFYLRNNLPISSDLLSYLFSCLKLKYLYLFFPAQWSRKQIWWNENILPHIISTQQILTVGSYIFSVLFSLEYIFDQALICLDKLPTYVMVLTPLPAKNCIDMNTAFSDMLSDQNKRADLTLLESGLHENNALAKSHLKDE